MASLAVMARMPILSAGKPQSRYPGFSLLEVLVVLVIFGLASALVMPALNRSLEPNLANTARDLLLQLRQVRSEAVLGQSPRIFWVDPVAREYQVAGREVVELPDFFEMDVLSAEIQGASGRGGFVFYPDGSSSGGSLTLRQGARELVIEVDWLTGHVALREGI